jgi:hypothetical protein
MGAVGMLGKLSWPAHDQMQMGQNREIWARASLLLIIKHAYVGIPLIVLHF